MPCTLLGTIQYNYGFPGFDNSFNARVVMASIVLALVKKNSVII
jgi:hypothetical protein